jgi:16S rRNA (cytidine1402-2'-O)-methyltransferase
VDMQRGEIVIVVAGAPSSNAAAFESDDVLRALIDELAPAQAAKIAAKLTGAKRSDLYERAIELAGKTRSR